MIALAITIFLIAACHLAAVWFGTHRKARRKPLNSPGVWIHAEGDAIHRTPIHQGRRRLP